VEAELLAYCRHCVWCGPSISLGDRR